MGHVSMALVTARMSHMDATLFQGSGVGAHEHVVHESKQCRYVMVAEQELCHACHQCAGQDVHACNGACKVLVVEHTHVIPTVVEYIGKTDLECHVPRNKIFLHSSPICPCRCHH
jgi:hypothetical protein